MMAKIDNDLIVKAVQLGNLIRSRRSEGNLQSVVPPTIYGYLAFLRMAEALPHLSVQQVALATLLGNASQEDGKHAVTVFNEVFGLHAALEDDPTLGGNFF